MPDKVQKTCSQCETKYTIQWDMEENELSPLTCPFCGYEIDNEEDEVEWVNREEDDSWD